MNNGLLWFDDDHDRDLEEVIIRGARRYRDKFGSWPTVAFAHPSVTDEEIIISIPWSQAEVTVRPDEATLISHFLFIKEKGD